MNEKLVHLFAVWQVEELVSHAQQLRDLFLSLAQQLTVISHYADACEQLMRRQSGRDSQSIIAWTAQITEQVELGQRSILRLQELVGHDA